MKCTKCGCVANSDNWISGGFSGLPKCERCLYNKENLMTDTFKAGDIVVDTTEDAFKNLPFKLISRKDDDGKHPIGSKSFLGYEESYRIYTKNGKGYGHRANRVVLRHATQQEKEEYMKRNGKDTKEETKKDVLYRHKHTKQIGTITLGPDQDGWVLFKWSDSHKAVQLDQLEKCGEKISYYLPVNIKVYRNKSTDELRIVTNPCEMVGMHYALVGEHNVHINGEYEIK